MKDLKEVAEQEFFIEENEYIAHTESFKYLGSFITVYCSMRAADGMAMLTGTLATDDAMHKTLD